MGIRGFFAEAEYLYSCYTILTVPTSILVFLITLNLFFIGKTMAKSALLFLKNLIFLHTYHNVLIIVCYLYCIFVCRRSTSAFRSWCFRHKFLLMMIVYAFILIIVGLANSKTFRYQLKKFGIFKQRWCLTSIFT